MSNSRVRPAMAVLGLVIWGLVGCGQTGMMEAMGKVREQMLRGNNAAALGVLREARKNKAFKEQDRVMFWMEEGMLLFLTRDYQKSTDVMEKCEQRTKELYTKSISKGIKAAFTSDAATDYKGESYENILLNVFKAMSFLAMKKPDAAMVEARKINEKLAWYNTIYKGKNTYNQDAFAHWLTGVLYEMEGSLDDARISYVKAYKTYNGPFAANYGMGAPSYLKEDIVRVATRNNSMEAIAEIRNQLGPDLGKTAQLVGSKGELIVFHLNGEGPSKTDYFVTCTFRSVAAWRCDGEPGGEFIRKTTLTIAPKADVVKVAFPRLITRQPHNRQVFIAAGDQRTLTEKAYPLNAIAQKALRDKAGLIFKDAVIRGITKFLTAKAAGAIGKQVGGGLFGALAKIGTSVAMQATEEADKRAWTTLPAEINIGRVWLEPGEHTVYLALPDGRVALPKVKIEAGKRVFLAMRTLP
ncbi:MAG: hypothetical protein H6707_10750 [Deltaproteobacteria bacterium]|nr:hypothetical protein [Deltaproteobacteria bacterium]